MNLFSGGTVSTGGGDTAGPTCRLCGSRWPSRVRRAADVVPGREVDIEASFEKTGQSGIGRDTHWNDAFAMSQRPQLLAATDLRLERADGEQGENDVRCVQLPFNVPRPARAAQQPRDIQPDVVRCRREVLMQTVRERPTVPVRYEMKTRVAIPPPL